MMRIWKSIQRVRYLTALNLLDVFSYSSALFDMGQYLVKPQRPVVPRHQTVLLLHEPKKPYCITENYDVPVPSEKDEVLVRVKAIGLNQIDWKAPDYNFGIPQLPYISGREFAGDIVDTSTSTRWKPGQKVISISTDYRDMRKAAYQEFAVALGHNMVVLPSSWTYEQGSTIGVAFVAAALGLGVSLGVDFSSVAAGPDLFKLVRKINPDSVPSDVRADTLHGIKAEERPRPGDWLTVWGGSATSANLTVQLAKLAGLRVIAVIDQAKHGTLLSNYAKNCVDVVVDSHDPARAVAVIRKVTRGKVCVGLDTRGRDTATHLLHALLPDDGTQLEGKSSASLTPPPDGQPESRPRVHVVGMSGLPKWPQSDAYMLHAVPIKLFHEFREVGSALTEWLSRLLEGRLIVAPEILGVEDGLESINGALDRMRRGEISAGKLVVKIQDKPIRSTKSI